jgi:hypothetical protein
LEKRRKPENFSISMNFFLQIIKGEHISKLSELPKRLANKVKGYLLLKDREDIIEQLT